jgi:glutathione S-transferase
MTDLQNPIELVGMMDSPFVRRVAIALSCYGLKFEINPLSVYNKPEQLAVINPLLTVPVLRCGNMQLLDSRQILQWIDAQVSHAWLRQFDAWAFGHIMAASDVLALKTGELYRETAWRAAKFRCPQGVSRITGQLSAALELLECDAQFDHVPMHHGSIALATSYCFAQSVCSTLDVTLPSTPRLAAYCDVLEAGPHFRMCI